MHSEIKVSINSTCSKEELLGQMNKLSESLWNDYLTKGGNPNVFIELDEMKKNTDWNTKKTFLEKNIPSKNKMIKEVGL